MITNRLGGGCQIFMRRQERHHDPSSDVEEGRNTCLIWIRAFWKGGGGGESLQPLSAAVEKWRHEAHRSYTHPLDNHFVSVALGKERTGLDALFSGTYGPASTWILGALYAASTFLLSRVCLMTHAVTCAPPLPLTPCISVYP